MEKGDFRREMMGEGVFETILVYQQDSLRVLSEDYQWDGFLGEK